MITVSNDYKTAVAAPVREFSAKLIVGDTVYTNLISLSFEGAGEYFASAMYSLVAVMSGELAVVAGTMINPQYAVKATSWEWVNRGNYYVTSCEYDAEKDQTTITAYSSMYRLQIASYVSNDITYPITIANFAQAVANKFGLTLSSMTGLPNISYVIQEDLYATISDINYRSIVEEIAGATGTMAVINDTTQTLTFRPIQTTIQDNLTTGNLRKYAIGAKYGPVNSVVLSRSPQEDNIAVYDQQSIDINGLTEAKLVNNEIMDDDRTYFAQPLLNALDGWNWYNFESTTEGHGYYEVGDMISTTIGNAVYNSVITSISLKIDGGMQETIKGVANSATPTDYSLAGGITKTIYDTELKVDRQGNQIVSLVSQHNQLQDQVNENYTQITQNMTEIVSSVQASGGNNLIRNSAMYSKDNNGLPLYWTLSGAGSLAISPSAEAVAHGSLSGQNITLSNKSISQSITVSADNESITEKIYYSFFCRVKKSASSTGSIVFTDGITSRTIDLTGALDYADKYADAMLPKTNTLIITVTGDEITITDMVLTTGNFHSQWQQANGELANTQVKIDIDGVEVRSSNLNNTYTTQTPQGFSSYKNGSLVSYLTNAEMSAPIVSTNNFNQPPLTIISQNDGWAIVEAI